MTNSSGRTCKECRHHTEQTHLKVLEEVYDTICDVDDKIVFFCAQPEVAGEGGLLQIGEVPRADCAYFEEPKQRGLDPELERLLARRVRDDAADIDEEEQRELRRRR